MLNGIDVSVWQGEIDWKKVKSSGVRFAILRAGYGREQDETFDRNYQEARKYGLPIGVYWYSYAGDTAAGAAEAAACLKALDGRSLELPVFFDQENEENILALSNRQRGDIVTTFCKAIRKEGYRAGIYSNLDFLTNKLPKQVRDRYPVWVAQYADHCDYDDPYMWQHSNRGRVLGVSGNVDMNYLYEEEKTMYRTFEDVPGWGKEAVKAAMDKNALRGEGKDSAGNVILNISEDMVRTLVVLHRLGLV